MNENTTDFEIIGRILAAVKASGVNIPDEFCNKNESSEDIEQLNAVREKRSNLAQKIRFAFIVPEVEKDTLNEITSLNKTLKLLEKAEKKLMQVNEITSESPFFEEVSDYFPSVAANSPFDKNRVEFMKYRSSLSEEEQAEYDCPTLLQMLHGLHHMEKAVRRKRIELSKFKADLDKDQNQLNERGKTPEEETYKSRVRQEMDKKKSEAGEVKINSTRHLMEVFRDTFNLDPVKSETKSTPSQPFLNFAAACEREFRGYSPNHSTITKRFERAFRSDTA